MNKTEIKAEAFDEILELLEEGEWAIADIKDIALKTLIKINNIKENNPVKNILKDADGVDNIFPDGMPELPRLNDVMDPPGLGEGLPTTPSISD